jgi:aminoglycoside phosphotransferase (APT) family kinase protein
MEKLKSDLRMPTPRDAADIAKGVLGAEIAAVERMPTGAGNWVFDVRPARGANVVVRILRVRDECAAGVYWSRTLRPFGVPLPAMLAHHVDGGDRGWSWMAQERLPGADLEHAHAGLTLQQRRDVAAAVVRAQQTVASNVPPGGGFGYVNWPRDWPHKSWGEVVHHELARSRTRIERVGAVDPRHVDRVESLLPRFADYFSNVRPTPFLDDTTTRNVIVHEGRLSGIVDVDSLCYGDPLFTVGLTRMALLNLNQPTDYIDHWLDLLGATTEQRSVVRFYTAVFCVNFLGEQGQQFNRAAAPPVDPCEVERLLAILGLLLMSS